MSEQTNYDEIEQQPAFDDALQELREGRDLPGPEVLYGLSALNQEQLAQFQEVWGTLESTYRSVLMQMLVDASEANYRLNYDAIGLINLDAPEPQVRQAAIEMLWEDESEQLLQHLFWAAKNDPALEVRAEAAKSLGRFVYASEMGHAIEKYEAEVQQILLDILRASEEALDVRRFALESLANCTHGELPQLIHQAYHSDEDAFRVSAVVAMGRSCDAQRWEDHVLRELDSHDMDMRREATRAAGELQLTDAVPAIVRFLQEGEREDQEVAIWSLGEIGGKEATRILQSLADGAEENEDEELAALIDDALGNASLADGDWMLLDIDPDELDYGD
ncbi:MAG: HEAT repeat domain-containing protein [Anaerolineae bacterium]|nr:HEAT repeat domain-containing protein [Anaerolineae bacterium]